MDDKALDRLFTGDLDQMVPLPKRVVRLFISSTFTDMMLERNSLMERVYPKLKKFCRERHGLDFQVVDMRWGVRDEATDDHQTVSLCSREIDNCQRMSLGPNFVALIGDKYGFRPLCNKIKSTEYRALRRCLIELDVSTDFLDTWYKEDLNAVPAEYLLQPISSILKNFTNKNEPELQSMDQRIWQAIQRRLHELLMLGSKRLVEQGRMSHSEQLMKYSISVTEREVIEGCLDVKEAKSSCLVYLRSIVDIREQLSNCLIGIMDKQQPKLQPDSLGAGQVVASNENAPPKALSSSPVDRRASVQIGGDTINFITTKGSIGGGGQSGDRAERRAERARRLLGRYIDLKDEGPDEEAQRLLNHLRVVKLDSKLGAFSGRALCKFEVAWDETEGMSLKSEQHRRYLSELTDHFYANLSKMIRRASRSDQGFKSGLIGEVLQHSHYAKHVSRSFHGRLNELDQIRNYILRGYEQRDEEAEGEGEAPPNAPMPMFVYGVGGSGKTAVLARAASQAKEWIKRARSLVDGGQRAASITGNAHYEGSGVSGDDEGRWDQRPCIIMRFCGTTPSSSSMVGVLTSVCRQLQYNFYQFGPLNGVMNQAAVAATQQAGAKTVLSTKDPKAMASLADSLPQLPYEPVAEDFVRLVFTFRQLVENCRHHYHRGRLFLIILDSVERLTCPTESSTEVKYSWLTSLAKLPPNVRLIVSCSSERHSSHEDNRDFIHLKRHFLRLYLPFDSGSDDSNQSSPGGEDSSSPYKEVIRASSSLVVGPLEPSGAAQRPRSGLASHLLKRLVIPAMRLRRGSQKLLSPEPSPPEPVMAAHHQLKRSTTSLGLESGQPRGRLSFTGRLSGELVDRSVDELSPINSKRVTDSRGAPINLVHVKPMGVELALSVARLWLQELGRTLTQQQWSLVRRSFAQCSRPIFVKLAFGEFVNWKSYSVQSDSKGLTFGSALLDGGRDLEAQLSNEAANDAHLRTLIGHYEPSYASASFKRQILAVEREWLNYLGYSQRRRDAEAAVAQSENGTTTDEGGMTIKLASGEAQVRLTGVAKGWSVGGGGGGLTSNVCHLSSTIDEAINQLFGRIELQHGYLLTKHSLSYITAARNGICENELEDILSLDDVVLDDVFQYHLPPVRRIPPLLWTRIRNDLPDYLSERDADGIVVNWHHNQFELVARQRYLMEPRQVRYIHSNMADYFLGRWADVAKPFRCTKQQVLMAAEQLESAIQQSLRESAGGANLSSPTTASISFRFGSGAGGGSGSAGSRSVASSGARGSRLRSSEQSDRAANWMQAKADRRVPQQPLHYAPIVGPSGAPLGGVANDRAALQANKKSVDELEWQQKRRYNLRKLTELPYHLMRSGRFADLANEVLFNYKWLYAAIDAAGLQSLLSDFEEASRSLEEALRERETSTLEHQKTESRRSGSGRREELNAAALRSMMSQLDVLNNTIRLSSSAIHSDTQMLAPQLIGRLLPMTRAADGAEVAEAGYLIQLLDQCDRDGCLDCALLPTDHCLQAPNGLQLSSLEGHSFGVLSLAMATDQRHLLAISNKFIMWDISTGEISRDVDPRCEGAMLLDLRMGLNDEYALSYTSSNTILVLDIITQQVVKFHELEQLDPIVGLELVDLFSASRFVVWTKRKWFILRLTRDGLPSSITAPQRVCVELERTLELPTTELNIQRVHHDDSVNLSFVEAFDRSVASLQLLTCGLDEAGQVNQVWTSPQIAVTTSFCLDPLLKQLIISDLKGSVLLCRRRTTRWSKPKLIWRSEKGPVLAIEMSKFGLSWRGGGEFRDESTADQLVAFERRMDGSQVEDEQKSSLSVGAKNDQSSSVVNITQTTTTLLLYLSDKIVVLRLNPDRIERSLALPRDVRNISVQPNRSQIKAIILQPAEEPASERFLAAASGRRLLLYSIDRCQLLRSIDAHAARCVQLIPIACQWSTGGEPLEPGDDRWLSFASASIDKTVKIWNLSNLDKDIHSLDKLDNPIECMSMASQQPWVACMGRAELGVWDWRTQRVLAKLSQHQLLLSRATSGCGESASEATAASQRRATSGSRLVRCRLSSDGRHLCLATQESIHLFATGEFLLGSSRGGQLKSFAEHGLPERGLVRKLYFFQQDSRLLTCVECPLDPVAGSVEPTSGGSDAARQEELARRVVILCHSIPDGHLLYTIDSVTPTLSHNAAADSHQQLAAAQTRQSPSGSPGRIRLPVLTRDQLCVVTVECGDTGRGSGDLAAHQLSSGGRQLRKRSAAGQVGATLLAVYSSRDGLLVRRIDLSHLEPYNRPATAQQLAPAGARMPPNQQQQQQPAPTSDGQRTDEAPLPAVTERGWPAKGPASSAVSGAHFTRLKSLAGGYRERQSVVALLDHERASLVDVNTRQLMGRSGLWSGKLSANGRLGLSRMFKSAGSLRNAASAVSPAAAAAAASANSAGGSGGGGQDAAANGLQLLEMGHCSPIKTLLTHSTLARLSSRARSDGNSDTAAGQQQVATGNDTDITCGFAGPNDSHVYYHDSRLNRLLLVRVRDARLVANYKLSTRLTKIKCSPDGYALVLGLADGSLTSLAIVDPQKDDTLVRLAQYPSRRHRHQQQQQPQPQPQPQPR